MVGVAAKTSIIINQAVRDGSRLESYLLDDMVAPVQFSPVERCLWLVVMASVCRQVDIYSNNTKLILCTSQYLFTLDISVALMYKSNITAQSETQTKIVCVRVYVYLK